MLGTTLPNNIMHTISKSFKQLRNILGTEIPDRRSNGNRTQTHAHGDRKWFCFAHYFMNGQMDNLDFPETKKTTIL